MIHFHNFGCDHKTACKRWVYDDEGDKANVISDFIPDVTCEDCIDRFIAQYGLATYAGYFNPKPEKAGVLE